VWLLGALGEELVYRGYLMNRVAGSFRNSSVAWTVGLIVVSVAFGCAHLDQGSTGMVENILNRLNSADCIWLAQETLPCR